MFNSTPSCINKSYGVAKILLKKNFNLGPKLEFYQVLIFVLVLVETDSSIKKRSDKWGIVWVYGTDLLKQALYY